MRFIFLQKMPLLHLHDARKGRHYYTRRRHYFARPEQTCEQEPCIVVILKSSCYTTIVISCIELYTFIPSCEKGGKGWH